jgi:molecular chaperone GrpE
MAWSKKSPEPEKERQAAAPADPENNAETQQDGAENQSTGVFVDDRITKLEAEKEELRNTLLRRQADFDNYRKRIERERHEESRRAKAHLIEHLLPVLDTFERALVAHDDSAYADYKKGFELIYRQLWDALAKQGLERIDALGKTFDPHVHQAIERVETDEHADGAVIEVLQPGYIFHGRVLRPATVRVAAAPAATSHKTGN